MDITILNYNLDAIKVFDTYNSLIWTDRYNEYGDFEIYTPMTDDILTYMRQGYYLQRKDSDHVMIIESLKVTTDIDEGSNLTVTGRSLESLLERRIIWGQKTVNGSLHDGIKTLLTENIISPSNADRKISPFMFQDSTDPTILALTIDAQYTGDNLYETIQKICAERDIGFRVTLNDSKQFVFELYMGVDRSYNQTSNSYVVFSPKFDNLISSNYIESKKPLKNVTLVGGEGEGSERRYTAVGNVAGISRREIFTDARDISSNTGTEGETMTNDEYIALLRQRGKEKLSENAEIYSFEGQAEMTTMFKYGEDFSMGDIVQVANEYGHEATARILELVTSHDETGYSVYPTFSTVPVGVVDVNTVLLLNGDSLADSSMYNNAIVNNNVTISSTYTKFGSGSLAFDGSTSYLRIKSNLFNFGDGNFTFDWWEYCTGNSATRFALSIAGECGGICAGGGYDANCLYMSSVGNVGASWDLCNEVAFNKTTAQWVHWAVVRSGNTVYTFRNGTLFWSKTVNGGIFWNDTGLVIGSFLYDTNHYFQGYIDEFRVSNIARWTSNFIPPSAPYEQIQEEGEMQV